MGPGWMIVLDGDAIQWKRSERSSAAIGPAVGSPAATRSIAASCARTSSASTPGAITANFAMSSAVRTPRNRRGRQSSATPTLKPSPRSTRGTSRSTA